MQPSALTLARCRQRARYNVKIKKEPKLNSKAYNNGGYLMGRKERKAQQRQAYKAAFKKVKHGHGGRAIRKKEEAALGR